jgi:hypothetical protein
MALLKKCLQAGLCIKAVRLSISTISSASSNIQLKLEVLLLLFRIFFELFSPARRKNPFTSDS